MTEQEIKCLFSQELKASGINGSMENVIRQMVFRNNDINWQDTYNIMLKEMPNLKLSSERQKILNRE